MKKILFVLFALVLSIPSFAQLRTANARDLTPKTTNKGVWTQGMITDVYSGSQRIGKVEVSFIGSAFRLENQTSQPLRLVATGQVTDKNGTANFTFRPSEYVHPGKVETWSYWWDSPSPVKSDRKIDHNSMNGIKIYSIKIVK